MPDCADRTPPASAPSQSRLLESRIRDRGLLWPTQRTTAIESRRARVGRRISSAPAARTWNGAAPALDRSLFAPRPAGGRAPRPPGEATSPRSTIATPPSARDGCPEGIGRGLAASPGDRGSCEPPAELRLESALSARGCEPSANTAVGRGMAVESRRWSLES